MTFRHVHLGAGALGLGLICPLVQTAKRTPTILNRSSAEGARRIEAIRAAGGYHLYPYKEEPRFISVGCAQVYEAVDIHALAAGEEELLLTTALKRDGLHASLWIIRQILEARGDRPTIVIACENQVDSSYLRAALEQQGFSAGTRTLFVRAVVDRICNRPQLTAGTLEVACERFGKIFVERMRSLVWPSLHRFITSSASFEEVDSIERTIERKKWLVNGPHLLMSLIAHYYRFGSVRAFVAEDFGARILKAAIQEIESLASGYYARRGIAVPGLAEFAESVRQRIAEFPQRYPEVVTRLSGPHSLPAFFEDYERKLVQLAMDQMQATGAKAPYFTALTSFIVVELIKDGRWIVDPS